MTYDLWYWDGIPGRGEFVRLALEAGDIPYRERAREKGAKARDMLADMDIDRGDPPFAPPYLVANGITIAQTSNILRFLGERHGLAPADTAGAYWVAQMQLTIADMVVEAHDVHHPIGSMLYYEDQKPELARRAEGFRAERMPKYLGYFERILERRGQWLAGDKIWSYADLSLFQLVEGLRYAFSRRMKTIESDYPKVMKLRDAVTKIPRVRDYLASDRRLDFNKNGIFRHYPELDGD